MGYLGFRIGEKKSHTLDLSKVPLFGTMEASEGNKILDTSAIIDGRIADVCEAGFIEGTFIIPQFVLYEIQHIADLQDPVRKTRGRRGLEILHRLQKQTQIKVKIVDIDFPKLKDVDSKLIALAKSLQGKIVTNDYNLNKVAELQGISVLNMNELATALKPAILPGEQLNIRIVKEGKEYGQGIGYLGRRHDGGCRRLEKADREDGRCGGDQPSANDLRPDDLSASSRSRRRKDSISPKSTTTKSM